MKLNSYPQELHETVHHILLTNKRARNSDIELYKAVLQKFYRTTDISKITLKGDIFASIKRVRQQIQRYNPYLRADEDVQKMRKDAEDKYLDYVRDYL